MFSALIWEVIVRFVDIDGIVDYHCSKLQKIPAKLQLRERGSNGSYGNTDEAR